MESLDVQLSVVAASAFTISIGVLSLPLAIDGFDPIPWLTLIIGGTFGVIVTIIVNQRSNIILGFLEKSEKERRRIALGTIKNNADVIHDSSTLYFDILSRNDGITVSEKKELLKTFLPRFKVLLSLIQGSMPALADSIDSEKNENLENNLNLMNDLFTVLEFGDDEQFENNISKLHEYSNNMITTLNEIN